MQIDDYLSTHLKEGERLIRVVRQHWAVMLPAVAGGGLLILLDFFLLAWWFRHHGWGVLGWLVVFGLAVTWLGRSIYLWSRNLLIVTNERVIDIEQRGLFERHVAEAPFDKIQDIRYSLRGVWATLFHFGTISLHTAGQDRPLDLRYVHDPVKIQEQLSGLQQHNHHKNSGPLTATDLVALVDQLKAHLSPDELDRLLKRSSSDHGATSE